MGRSGGPWRLFSDIFVLEVWLWRDTGKLTLHRICRADSMAKSKSNRSEDDKIALYEAFLDNRLKPDLVAAIGLRDKVFAQQKVYSDLAKNIRLLQEQRLTNLKTNLRTMINLGSEVYGQAQVPDAIRIFLDIDLGFYAEFTLDEALGFIIPAKEAMLRKQVEHHTAEIAKIMAQSKLVVGGIQELLNIPGDFFQTAAAGGLFDVPIARNWF